MTELTKVMFVNDINRTFVIVKNGCNFGETKKQNYVYIKQNINDIKVLFLGME